MGPFTPEQQRAFAAQILEDPIYRQNLMTRLQLGKAPHIEKFLFEHYLGKPVERIAVHTSTDDDLTQLSDEELHARIAERRKRIDAILGKRIAQSSTHEPA